MSLNKNKTKKSDKNDLMDRLLGMTFANKEEIKLPPEDDIIKEIKNLKEKNLNEEIIVELNGIIKNYLKIKFRLIQSLTYEEIMEKLKKKKIDKTPGINLLPLLSKINQKEYFPHKETKSDEINSLLDLAIKTLEEIKAYQEPEEDIKKTESAKEGVRENIRKIEVTKEEIKEDIEKTENVEENGWSNKLIELKRTLNSIRKESKIDWESLNTRNNYERIKIDYSRLSDKEKRVIYPQIISIFKLKED